MAIYNNIALSGDGALGEALTATQLYTFTFVNTNAVTPPTGDGTDPFTTNDCYFVMNSDRATYEGVEFTTATRVGSIKGGLIPINQNFTTTVNNTFSFNVTGGTRGGGAVIAITTVGGVMERANVTRGGSNFISGDTITISQADLIAGGFTAANQAAIFNITTNVIDGWYTASDFTGTYGTTTGDLTTTNFIFNYRNSGSNLEVLTSVGFKLKQTLDTPLAGSTVGSFQFTPTATLPVNSYTLQCTGNMQLTIV